MPGLKSPGPWGRAGHGAAAERILLPRWGALGGTPGKAGWAPEGPVTQQRGPAFSPPWRTAEPHPLPLGTQALCLPGRLGWRHTWRGW